jgi:hypothetical protein
MRLDGLWVATSPTLATGVCTAAVVFVGWLGWRAAQRFIEAAAGAE